MAEKKSAENADPTVNNQYRKKTIVFLHPDLGIGGAERLVVDAAVGLQDRGNKVVIFTSHCDPKHCFDEARDGTLDVRIRGNTLIPPSILGRFSILCAILRQLHLLLQIYSSTSEMSSLKPDVFFVDQLSAGLPLLRFLLSFLFASGEGPSPLPLPSTSDDDENASGSGVKKISTKIFFYCHYPDMLLARGRDRWWKRAYRVPFDTLERWSMGFADAIAVNSNFTRSVVARTWPGLASRKELLTVYPCVDTTNTDDDQDQDQEQEQEKEKPLWNGKPFLLSINRFERKKDVALAIRAFAGLGEEKRGAARLVVAGGYDPRVAENVAYHHELEALASELGLSSRTARATTTALFDMPDDIDVVFLLSVPHALKEALLRGARLLVYTPAGEHFGIVPLEAMLRGLPVLAADSGGPRETVVEDETGWLRDPKDVEEWTDVMHRVLRLPAEELDRMRHAGVRRVREGFGQEQMAERLDGVFERLISTAQEMGEDDDGGSAYVMVAAATIVIAILVAASSVLLAVFLSGSAADGEEKVVWAEA